MITIIGIIMVFIAGIALGHRFGSRIDQKAIANYQRWEQGRIEFANEILTRIRDQEVERNQNLKDIRNYCRSQVWTVENKNER